MWPSINHFFMIVTNLNLKKSDPRILGALTVRVLSVSVKLYPLQLVIHVHRYGEYYLV